MSLVLAVLLVGLLLGRLAGGSVQRLGTVPVHRRRLVVAALLVQLAGTVIGGPFHPLGLLASAGIVVAFLLANRGLRGTGLIALGLLLNAVVIGANGAMPVSSGASLRAGADLEDVRDGIDPRHELADDATRLAPLGDVVPVPLPGRPEVVSPGDVLIAAGLGQLLVAGMRARRPARMPQPLSRQPS